MPNFTDMFEKTMGKSIRYKDREIFRADKFPVKNRDKLVVSIETTNSNSIQGLIISVKGYLARDGEILKKGKKINLVCWEDAQGYSPKHMEIQVYTKENFVTIWNVWEGSTIRTSIDQSGAVVHKEAPATCSWTGGAAMYSEEIEGGKRYFCNDGEDDDDFDDIIFTVKNLGQPKKK